MPNNHVDSPPRVATRRAGWTALGAAEERDRPSCPGWGSGLRQWEGERKASPYTAVTQCPGVTARPEEVQCEQLCSPGARPELHVALGIAHTLTHRHHLAVRHVPLIPVLQTWKTEAQSWEVAQPREKGSCPNPTQSISRGDPHQLPTSPGTENCLGVLTSSSQGRSVRALLLSHDPRR